ncbi:MAG: ABC transporter permease [Dehalococcoidia bacterium]
MTTDSTSTASGGPQADIFAPSARKSFWMEALGMLVRQHTFEFAVGGGCILLMLLAGIFAPLIARDDPNFQDVRAVSAAPSLSHPFGTDNIGRDLFSRVAYGARVSLTVGFASVALGIAVATIVGVASGYSGRWIDMVLQRFVDMLMAFPTLILILLVVSIFGSNLRNVIFAISIFLIAAPSRVVRAEVLSVKERPYIEAARSIGCTNFQIIMRHILPNIVHIVVIMISINIGGAIIVEASLSFLGLGVPPPAATWGNMIAGPGTFYLQKAPWMVLAPGLALALTVYAFNMLGDALRDVLDPRLRVG